MPDIYLTFEEDLERTERLIDRSAGVKVLVIGPKIGGPALNPKKRTRLEEELSRRLPDVNFQIIDEGTAPGLARDDFERLRAAIERHQPDLVIWQVGVADAVAATDLDDFSRVLERAAEWLQGRDIDLVLVDPPFLPNVSHERAYGRIVRQIDQVSDKEGLNVVQQYAATGYLQGPQPPGGEKRAEFRQCLPELIAEAIVRATTR